MIKIGKLTDYAVVLLTEMSRSETGVLRSAHSLSETTGLPEPTVAKLLKSLAEKDIVLAVRGTAGGYKLARAAKEISCADIIIALEGPIKIVSCVEGEQSHCQIGNVCKIKGHWDGVNAAIVDVLKHVKLSDMQAGLCGKDYTFITGAERKMAEK